MAKAHDARTFACEQCGTQHTVSRGRMPERRLCPPCRIQARNVARIEAMGGMAAWNAYCRQQREKARAAKLCPHCKAAPPKRSGTYCSTACQKQAGAEKIRARKGQSRIEDHRAARREAALRTCEVCERRFMRSGWGNASRFCGRACAIEARVVAAQRRRSVQAEVLALRAIAKSATRHLRRLEALRERRLSALKPCLTCARAVGARRLGLLYCSKDCSDKSAIALETKRAARLKRKAMERAAAVENVRPIRVFERDGWRCHLCGGLTIKAKLGTYHPRAPELDHIVPLSKGGPHSYANTACAHRKCNAAKSDRIIGQPSLLAA